MKVKLSDLSIGSCFRRKEGSRLEKKVGDHRVARRGKGGKVRTRRERRDPEVDSLSCPIEYIGIGMRGHPGEVVEIGDGRPRRFRGR